MIYSINGLRSARLGGGLSDELLPGAHVLEDDRVVFWVEILFHGKIWLATGGEDARISHGVKIRSGNWGSPGPMGKPET